MRYRRNRKKNEPVAIVPLRLVVTLFAAAAISFTYLWLQNRCEVLGRQIKELERQHESLRREILQEEYQLANMKTPQNIDRLLKHFGIQMGLPEPSQIVVIPSHAPTRSLEVAVHLKSSETTRAPLVHD